MHAHCFHLEIPHASVAAFQQAASPSHWCSCIEHVGGPLEFGVMCMPSLAHIMHGEQLQSRRTGTRCGAIYKPIIIISSNCRRICSKLRPRGMNIWYEQYRSDQAQAISWRQRYAICVRRRPVSKTFPHPSHFSNTCLLSHSVITFLSTRHTTMELNIQM